jgi:hypothetical protein
MIWAMYVRSPPPRADMCSALGDVCFVPEADIPIPGCRYYYSHTSH